jgi:hypothetical protein
VGGGERERRQPARTARKNHNRDDENWDQLYWQVNRFDYFCLLAFFNQKLGAFAPFFSQLARSLKNNKNSLYCDFTCEIY